MEITVTNAVYGVRAGHDHVELRAREHSEAAADGMGTFFVLRLAPVMAGLLGRQLIEAEGKWRSIIEKGERPFAAECTELQGRIETLACATMLSDRALNVFNTPHVAFANGAIKQQGERMVAWPGDAEVFEQTFAMVKAYRDERAPNGPAWLTWRCYPEVEVNGEDGRMALYMRLSFDPAPAMEPLA